MFENYKEITKFISDQYANSIYGLESISYTQEDQREDIAKWAAWYSGIVDGFHDYSVYNGKEFVKVDRNTLEMAKKVCEDKADLLLNEKVVITVDEGNQDYLNEVLENNLFREKANELIEKTNALSTGAFVEFVDNGVVSIDYLTTDKIIPLSVVCGQVKSCAFASTETVLDKTFVYLNVHIYIKPLENLTEEEITARNEMNIPQNYEGYVIENLKLQLTEGSYKEVDTNEFEQIVITNSKIPYFQIIKPAKANNKSMNETGLGVSAFANAISQLKAVDVVYDSYINEFESGRTRMFVHDSLAQIETEGSEIMKPMFDKRETVFYALDMGEDAANKIQTVQPELRVDEHEKALNKQLNLLSLKCGLGSNYYKFENGVLKTATEVISEENPLFRTIKKDQHILRRALKGMVLAIFDLSSRAIEATENETISIELDDSIFQDTAEIKKTALLEFNSDIIDRVEYFMETRGLTEQQAIDLDAKITSRQPKEVMQLSGAE